MNSFGIYTRVKTKFEVNNEELSEKLTVFNIRMCVQTIIFNPYNTGKEK